MISVVRTKLWSVVGCIGVCFLSVSLAAENAADKYEHVLDISGYINYKAFYDTRQIVGTSDDQTAPKYQL